MKRQKAGYRMGKSTYSIKESKGRYSFTYSGDLGEAIEKAKADLKKEQENTEFMRWEWIKKKADAAITAHFNRVRRITAFIECAERHLAEERAAGNEETTQAGE